MVNVITESMYAECDDSGNEYLIMDSIVDYRKDDKAIKVPEQKVAHRGRSFMPISTVGWKLCVQWRDVSMSWKSIKD